MLNSKKKPIKIKNQKTKQKTKKLNFLIHLQNTSFDFFNSVNTS